MAVDNVFLAIKIILLRFSLSFYLKKKTLLELSFSTSFVIRVIFVLNNNSNQFQYIGMKKLMCFECKKKLNVTFALAVDNIFLAIKIILL